MLLSYSRNTFPRPMRFLTRSSLISVHFLSRDPREKADQSLLGAELPAISIIDMSGMYFCFDRCLVSYLDIMKT